MKRSFQKIAVAWAFLIPMLIPARGRAAAKKEDITTRINTIRKSVNQKIQDNNLIDIDGRTINNSPDLNTWVNWGKWANWNNWNNWANWANWNNWANWRNF